MFDLPTMQGATATVLMAVYILACDEARNSSSIRPPPIAKVLERPVGFLDSAEISVDAATLMLSRPCASWLAFSCGTSTHIGKWWTNLYFFFSEPAFVSPQSLSTMRPHTPRPTQTLQSMIHTMSPTASRYPLLMFRIFGLGPNG